MKTYKIKFFGSKDSKKQIRMVKMLIKSEDKESIFARLEHLGYKVINSLKIHDYEET